MRPSVLEGGFSFHEFDDRRVVLPELHARFPVVERLLHVLRKGVLGGKMKSIVVNGRAISINLDVLSYWDLVSIVKEAGDPSVSWSCKEVEGTRTGTLFSGEKVKLSDGMVFNVMHTGNA